MCGLAGFVNFSANVAPDGMLAEIKRMTDTLVHRGPDDSDYWVNAETGLALGHRRLSILDLSPAGRQPMVSANGRCRIVFNGEIYNFDVVRDELVAAGHPFRGHSDTEVLLEAAVQSGIEETLRRCVGMFAFALWDSVNKTVTLARDRMGEKPLYYGWVGERFVFASELRAFRQIPGWRGDLSPEATTLFLRYGYIPAPHSIYRGVYKLPPATLLTLRLDRGARQPINPDPEISPAGYLTPIRYWSLRGAAEAGLADPIRDADEAVDTLEQLLGESVTRQMVADVPLGAFLSAGIDSATVVALMQKRSSRPVKTFTIGFQEKAFDEAEYARAIARHLGTEHTEMYVTEADALRHVPSLATVYDEPFADSSQLPTMLLSELVRRHVTVCLTGDGGDELFGGYNRYWWSRRMWDAVSPCPTVLRKMAGQIIRSTPAAVWNTLSGMAGPLLPRALAGSQTTPAEKLRKIADALGSRDFVELYKNLMSYWKQPAALVPGASEPITALSEQNKLVGVDDDVQHLFYWDQSEYLADDNLVKVDRASMAVSLETRVPLLDHRLVEFSWRIPVDLKYRENVGKWLLRQVLYRHVPRTLMDRPKMGFSVPVGRWLRGNLRDWAEALLSDAAFQRHGLLDPAMIRTVWADHLSGRVNAQSQLWTVLMLQSWIAAQRA